MIIFYRFYENVKISSCYASTWVKKVFKKESIYFDMIIVSKNLMFNVGMKKFNLRIHASINIKFGTDKVMINAWKCMQENIFQLFVRSLRAFIACLQWSGMKEINFLMYFFLCASYVCTYVTSYVCTYVTSYVFLTDFVITNPISAFLKLSIIVFYIILEP